MDQITITKENQAVVITQQGKQVSARLYVNARDGLAHASITPLSWSGKTVAGAKRWAEMVMGPVTPLRVLAA